MKQYRRHTLLALSLVLGLLTFSACDANDPGAEGRIHVLLTDAPLDDVAEAHVTIQRVELLSVDGGRVVLADREMEFDLLELRNGVTASLADVSVPEAREDAAVVGHGGVPSRRVFGGILAEGFGAGSGWFHGHERRLGRTDRDR